MVDRQLGWSLARLPGPQLLPMLGVCCAPFPIHLQVPLGPDQAMYFFLHPPSHLTHQHLQPFPSSKVQEIAPNWIKKNDKSFHTSRAGRVSSSQVGVEGSPTPHLQKGLLSSTCCVKWEGKAMILPLAPLPACSPNTPAARMACKKQT